MHGRRPARPPPAPVTVTLSTGTNTIILYDAGNERHCQGGSSEGVACTPNSQCPGGTCALHKFAPSSDNVCHQRHLSGGRVLR